MFLVWTNVPHKAKSSQVENCWPKMSTYLLKHNMTSTPNVRLTEREGSVSGALCEEADREEREKLYSLSPDKKS